MGVADDLGLVLELVGWETHSWPGIGSDAQDVINSEIPEPDVVVGVFWKRLGTPTTRALSGTVEEIERALELRANGRHVELLVYFNQAAYTPQPEELQQISKVMEFRRKLEERGFLVGAYNGVTDFEKKVRTHLTQVIRRWPDSERKIANGAEKNAALKQSGRPSEWRDQIMSGRLSTDIDPPLGGRSYAFVSAVGTALVDMGFDAKTHDHVRIILVELLNNVARHANSAASIEIEVIPEGNFRTVDVLVASTGPSFSVDELVQANIDKLEAGDREHGLLRVRRLADRIRSVSDKNGVTSVRCEVYQRPSLDSVLYRLPTVLPICFEYSFPKYLWIGRDGYTEESFDLLRQGGPATQGLFFSPATPVGAAWLGVESTCPFTGAGNWSQLVAGSGGSQGLPSSALRMASGAVMPWAAAVSR